jgi:hypothetical protein
MLHVRTVTRPRPNPVSRRQADLLGMVAWWMISTPVSLLLAYASVQWMIS